MTEQQEISVGIDISKDSPDYVVNHEICIDQVGNDRKGIARLVAEMRRNPPSLIVVEATGGYEQAVVTSLFQAGLPVALVSP
jgi:transposase